jgi:hypothetical protein
VTPKEKDLIYMIEGLLEEKIVVKLRPLLMISEDLDFEVDRAASMYGYYAVLSEKADTRYQRLKYSYEKWRAEHESREQRLRATEGKKAFTEAQMRAEVQSQPKFRTYQVKIIHLEEQKRVLKIIAKALEFKKDLVQTKCANRRGESKAPSGK